MRAVETRLFYAVYLPGDLTPVALFRDAEKAVALLREQYGGWGVMVPVDVTITPEVDVAAALASFVSEEPHEV